MENGSELTVLTPFGPAKRCRAVSKASGQRCGKAARRGAEVCGVHGVGHGSRVRDGRRTDPRLARITTGLRAKAATLEVLGQVDPRFAEARAQYLADPTRVFDPTEVLADLHGLRRLASERVEFCLDERGVEHAPPLLDILNAIIAAQERAFRLRTRTEAIDSIDVHLVDAFVVNCTNIITQYVDPQDVAAALDRLRELQEAVVPATRDAPGRERPRYG
jgi:hypothetical protein